MPNNDIKYMAIASPSLNRLHGLCGLVVFPHDNISVLTVSGPTSEKFFLQLFDVY